MGGHDYKGPRDLNAIPEGHVRTKETEEQFAIRELVTHRGMAFTLAMFRGTVIGIIALQDIYMGRPITEAVAKVLKAVLKERMTLT